MSARQLWNELMNMNAVLMGGRDSVLLVAAPIGAVTHALRTRIAQEREALLALVAKWEALPLDPVDESWCRLVYEVFDSSPRLKLIAMSTYADGQAVIITVGLRMGFTCELVCPFGPLALELFAKYAPPALH